MEPARSIMSITDTISQHDGHTDEVSQLLGAIGPDLYRTNSFRVVGMPVDATERTLAKQAERLKMRERLAGGLEAIRGALALRPAPDADSVREAMQRLRDPERRLVDELFWFWPTSSGDTGDDLAPSSSGKENHLKCETFH